jgi:tRNA(Ile)-lysidine synthase
VKAPEPLLQQLAASLEALGCRGRRLLVAASAGVDSTVLAHGVHAVREELALGLVLGHVQHGLRGAEADADEAFVRSLGAALGAPVGVRRVAPRRLREGVASRQRPTLQEAARSLRRAALSELAGELGADIVATAHTLDDQAETVLLRLLRGSGPSGMGGIPERSLDGRVVRPLLGVSRAEVERFAHERGLVWREDASNRDRSYSRARLRREWLPGLGEAFNPRWLRAIGDLAEAQRRESEWIEELVTREANVRLARLGTGWRLDCTGLAALPEALVRRLLRRWLHEAGAGRDVSRRHLERMRVFLVRAETGKRLELPGGLSLERVRGAALLRQRSGGQAQHGC